MLLGSWRFVVGSGALPQCRAAGARHSSTAAALRSARQTDWPSVLRTRPAGAGEDCGQRKYRLYLINTGCLVKTNASVPLIHHSYLLSTLFNFLSVISPQELCKCCRYPRVNRNRVYSRFWGYLRLMD